MQKKAGYNRNLMYGKRLHKGIQTYGKYKTLEDRLIAESQALERYLQRIKK